eukprot:scaffold451287_cov30-Prasinocladus_malaysianus.AAC.1
MKVTRRNNDSNLGEKRSSKGKGNERKERKQKESRKVGHNKVKQSAIGKAHCSYKSSPWPAPWPSAL